MLKENYSYICAYLKILIKFNFSVMKNIYHIVWSVVILATMVSCDFINSLSYVKPSAIEGKPYELIVVCNMPQWQGAVGDTLRSVLSESIVYLNQVEPIFDVQVVSVQNFSSLVEKHRNILKVLIDPSLKKAVTIVAYNAKAMSQVTMTLQGPTEASIIEYLTQNGDKIVRVFEKAERERAIDNAVKYGKKDVQNIMKSTFDVVMNVPDGYIVADSMSDFVWARNEFPMSSQGFFAYSYPLHSKSQLTENSLITTRNMFAMRIPGAAAGSYMTTALTLSYRPFKLNGRNWIEMRGLWDVEGDFMGGPYVSYTTIDEVNRRIFTFDGYVYSPRIPKRNYLRGVEHLMNTIKFSKPAEE